jgi:hypothetical protein
MLGFRTRRLEYLGMCELDCYQGLECGNASMHPLFFLPRLAWPVYSSHAIPPAGDICPWCILVTSTGSLIRSCWGDLLPWQVILSTCQGSAGCRTLPLQSITADAERLIFDVGRYEIMALQIYDLNIKRGLGEMQRYLGLSRSLHLVRVANSWLLQAWNTTFNFGLFSLVRIAYHYVVWKSH